MDEFQDFSARFGARKRARQEPEPAPRVDRPSLSPAPGSATVPTSPRAAPKHSPSMAIRSGATVLPAVRCVCGAPVKDDMPVFCPYCLVHQYCSYKCRVADILDHRRLSCAATKPRPVEKPLHVYGAVGAMDEDTRVKFLRQPPPKQPEPPANSLTATASQGAPVMAFDSATLVPHVKRVAALECAYHFRHLPSVLVWPTYYRVVTNPVSLDAISRKCRARRYRTLGDFVADCMQIVDNSRTFNGDDALITSDAKATVRELLQAVTQAQCALCARPAVALCPVCRMGRCASCPVCATCTIGYRRPRSVECHEVPVPEPDADALAHLIYCIPVELTGHFVQMLDHADLMGHQDLMELAPGEDSKPFEIAPEMIPQLFRRLLPLVT